MRRFLSLFTMLMLCGVLAFAQSRVVTGKVTDADGNPVAFASVKIKGSASGAIADANGAYSLKVNPNTILVITAQGLKETEVPVGTQNVLSTVMEKAGTTEIKEVVVTTAFQTKRSLRSQSSNVQNVSSDQLNTVRASNVNNAIAGKVAGAQVRSQSAGALGRETTVRLRGENGLGVGNGPIYVVDGTIMPSTPNGTNGSGGGGGGDINPDDVDNITVLQGPASAALFGPDGANGAIVITTKRARKNSASVEINSGITFDEAYKTPNYQNTYAGGSNSDMIQFHWVAGMPDGWKALDGKYYHNYDDDASWGPRMNGQEYIPAYAWFPGHERSFKTAQLLPQPTNIKDFYNIGVTRTNNVNFSKATDVMNLRVSYTNLDIKGIIPNSYLRRNTFNTNLSIEVTPRLTVAASINYVNQKRNSESDDGYSNMSSGSFNQWFHRELDMDYMRQLRNVKSPEGVYATWNPSNPDSYDPLHPESFYKANYWYNPYTYFDLVKNYDSRDRLFGDISATYKINNDLKAKVTYRRQQLTTSQQNTYPLELEKSGVQAGFNPYAETSAESGQAAYQTGQSFNIRQNYEGLLSYSKKIKSFAVNVNAGIDILKQSSRVFNANTSGGLSIPGVYSLANSVKELRNNGSKQLETITEFRRRSLFVSGDIGFRNFAFVEGSYRRDYASGEPASNPYIDTKSIGASIVFSDFIKNKNILSYGKIRASWGQILNTLNAYDLGTYYVVSGTVGANPTMSEPNTIVDPKLHGAVNDEKEIGIELRFAKNRFGITATYWDRTNKDFPVTITTSGTSGYTGIRTNAGEVAKTGVDLQAFLKVLNWKNLTWDLNATWGRLIKNKVVSIAADGSITRLISGGGTFSPNTGTSTRAAWVVSEIGQQWGQLHGTGIKRNAAGIPVLNADGTYQAQQDVNYGSILPDYTGGVQSSMTVFKNFVFNVNVDYSWGGKFFSLSDYWGSFSGLTAKTAVLNDKGNSIRDLVADGGGVHVVGVDASDKPYDVYVDAKRYFSQFSSSNISETNVYDLTYVKLRELSLGYKVPMERLGIGKYIKSATVSIIARNPWLIYAKTKDFDPSEISNTSGEDGQYPGTRSLGFNIKLGF